MSVEICESGKPITEPYPTTSIEIAATLMAVGHKCVDLRLKIEKNNEARVELVFDRNDVKATLKDWVNGDVKVNARQLLNNLADLKDMVHNKAWHEPNPSFLVFNENGAFRKKRRKGNGQQQTDKPKPVGDSPAAVSS